MWRPRTPSRLTADTLALQGRAECAGLALGCIFASSSEFEAAVIRAKRDAGAYGPKRHRLAWVCAGAVLGVLIVCLFML
jgi:hypothetical protein